ncbi:MAG: hypothetical protein OXN95_04785 [bacterium]|nr:hypothetical protein [bacterium]
MPVTEIERRELVNRLVATIGEESTETLMQCLLTDGRDQLATKDDLKSLATKDDLKALENTLRAEMATKDDLNNLRLENKAEFASLRSYIDSTMNKQMRIYVAMLVGVMLTIWGSMVVYAVA